MGQVERFPFRRVFKDDRQFKEYLAFWKSSGMTDRHARGVAILCKEIDDLKSRLRRVERRRYRTR
jgi:hypothetical protein